MTRRIHISYPDAKQTVWDSLKREMLQSYDDHGMDELSPFVVAICEQYLAERQEEQAKESANGTR